jgi:2-polyprenyl-3-methyl-5-hydroxy-6-metoxy-1,4-benzoquinol methylase
MPTIIAACAAVRRDVELTSSGADDLAYFSLHELRFQAAARRVVELVPPDSEILDVGSHYLHLSSILSLLGYRVSAMDIPQHATLPFVSERAARMGITIHIVDEERFARGDFMGSEPDRFHAIMFCEILEHITFNPIAFWRRVHQLVRPGGLIYVTTPNSMKLLSVLGALWNLASMRRTGLSVTRIMQGATYGHHWKEYSASEIVEYFAWLSPDFRVQVRRLHYGRPNEEIARAIGPLRTALIRLGNFTRYFADNLEAIITVPEKTQWRLVPPTPGD